MAWGIFSELLTASLVSIALVFDVSYIRNLAKDYLDTSSWLRVKKKKFDCSNSIKFPEVLP